MKMRTFRVKAQEWNEKIEGYEDVLLEVTLEEHKHEGRLTEGSIAYITILDKSDE
jgi:hypothetical protein